MTDIQFPAVFEGMFRPARYKTWYGGRGSGKSHSVAAGLVARAYTEKLRILCAREFQASMRDSVHRLLCDRIELAGLTRWFDVTERSIISRTTGSEFLFKGLRHNVGEIKSLEGINICWVEEAQSVSETSWRTLEPTIRAEGSEIWTTFNTYLETDPTYVRRVKHALPGDVVVKVGWRDNPFFPKTLDQQRLRDLQVDEDAYSWIWGGNFYTVSASQVFKGRVSVECFEPPRDTHFRYGVDWGFANDPTVMVRTYVHNNVLFFDQEAYGVGIELDDLDRLFRTVPGAMHWPIKADGSRPETIAFMKRRGYSIMAAKKWPGSVEDGIARMKGYDRIVVHEQRCPRTAEEFRLYSFKTDPVTNDVLPILVDKWNHCIDAGRYSLDGEIQGRGAMRISQSALMAAAQPRTQARVQPRSRAHR